MSCLNPQTLKSGWSPSAQKPRYTSLEKLAGELAGAKGYYTNPSEEIIGEIADDMHISCNKSRKLIASYFKKTTMDLANYLGRSVRETKYFLKGLMS